MESFIRANQHSENHKKVLECFLESRRADLKVDARGDDKGNKQTLADMDKALASLASFGASTIPTSSAAPNTDSPASPPPAPGTGKTLSGLESSGSGNGSKSLNNDTPPAKTLLALWTAKTEKKNLRVITNTKLYSHLASGKDSVAGSDEQSNTVSNGGGKKTITTGGKKSDVSSKT